MGIKDDCEFLFVTKYGNEIRPLHQDAFNNIFLRLAKKMGQEFKTDPGTFNMLRSHNFRKFFKSQMQNAGVPAWQCEYMMGHTLSPLDKAYFIADKDKLKENYFKHLDAISIEQEVIIQSVGNEQYQQQANELKELKNQMAAMQELFKLSAKHSI